MWVGDAGGQLRTAQRTARARLGPKDAMGERVAKWGEKCGEGKAHVAWSSLRAAATARATSKSSVCDSSFPDLTGLTIDGEHTTQAA